MQISIYSYDLYNMVAATPVPARRGWRFPFYGMFRGGGPASRSCSTGLSDPERRGKLTHKEFLHGISVALVRGERGRI